MNFAEPGPPVQKGQIDWDKLRIFHAAAQEGSFTRAGETLDMSQSAVSRQVSALEQELGTTLFHRHARGLIPTAEGELLMRATRDIILKLENVRAQLVDSRGQPTGTLRVTTTVGLGSTWLTSRVHEFLDLYPGIHLELILDDDELDVAMRQADVAIRLRAPTQPDLIQRKLFTVHFHVYASPAYIKRFGEPKTHRRHRQASHRHLRRERADLPEGHELAVHGRARAGQSARTPSLSVNNIVAIRHAVEKGVGIAMLPDYLVTSGMEARDRAARFRGAELRLLLRLSGGAARLGARDGVPRFPPRQRKAWNY